MIIEDKHSVSEKTHRLNSYDKRKPKEILCEHFRKFHLIEQEV